MNSKTREVYCRKCNVGTKLLWMHSISPLKPPLCERCFRTLKTEDAKEASEYKVHFRPLIHSPQPQEWQLSNAKQYEYRELGIFIQDCIDARGRDMERNPYLTKDKETLRALLHILLDLLPDTMPTFAPPKKIYPPSHINQVSSKERNKLLQKYNRENSQRYRIANETYEKRAQSFRFKQRIIPGLRSAIENIPDGKKKPTYTRYGIPVHRVYWKILPQGKHPFAAILEYFEELRRNNYSYEYKIERIRKIYDLQETDVYVGLGEFEGYVVFDHSQYGFAILECPIVGNAVYVLKGDWRTLSMLSKQELLDFHRKEIIRVVHLGDWYYRVKVLFNALQRSSQRDTSS